MSYLTEIQQRIEKLVLGEHGSSPYSIEQGRFTLLNSDTPDVEYGYESTAERTFEVDIESAVPLNGSPNLLDGFYEATHNAVVKVSYQLTNAGADTADGISSIQIAGTDKAIRDRAITDLHDITRVVCWHENCAGLNPNVFGIQTGNTATVRTQDTKVILTIPFVIFVTINTTQSYV